MLVFVVPLKSRKVSQSWERVCQLFERSIKSICNQTSPDFRVIVVCNDQPEITFTHPHITYLEVDFPPPKESSPIVNGDTDKGRKILAGVNYARQLAPSHTMFVDADDCVSKHLAEFVNKHSTSNGWFINKGYKYREGSKFIYLKNQEFHHLSGSCNIIKYELNDLPENPEYDRGCGYYKFYIFHKRISSILAEKGTPIAPLPFAGAVYVLENGENLSANKYQPSFNWLNCRILTPATKDEFGLYKL